MAIDPKEFAAEFDKEIQKALGDTHDLRVKLFDMIPEDTFKKTAYINHILDTMVAITIIVANGDVEHASSGIDALFADAQNKLKKVSDEMKKDPNKFFATLQ